MRFYLDIKGDAKAAKQLELLSQRAMNLKPALDKVADTFQGSLQKNFDSYGSTLGVTWRPLSESTAEQKTTSQRMLVDTGALREGLHGGQNSLRKVTKTLVRVGVKKPLFYALIHNTGYTSPRFMPGRKVIGYDPKTRSRAVKHVIDHFNDVT